MFTVQLLVHCVLAYLDVGDLLAAL